MSFLRLVQREMQGSLHKLFIMVALAGLANFALLAAINSGAQISGGNVSLATAGLFVISLLVFVRAQHYVLVSVTAEIEAIIHRLRLRLMDQVRDTELQQLESTGRAELVGAVTGATAALTIAANTLTFAGQSVLLVIFVGFYVAYLSPLGFLVSTAVIGVAVVLYHFKGQHLASGRAEAAKWSNQLFDRLGDFLDGFKEVRLNRARSNDLYADASEVSRRAANIKISTEGDHFERMTFAQMSIYLLLGTFVFIVPMLTALQGTSISKATLALVFVVGSCFGLIQAVPVLDAANEATERIEQLEARLQAATAAAQRDVPPPAPFERIEMRGVTFRYADAGSDTSFQVGPVDFTLNRGELVFITGGNGSGKSTFLKVLAGLYHPDAGEIRCDGMPVEDATRDSYRALIAAIFSDYHLFRRLYGIPDADPAEIERLLTEFRLRDKTHLVDGEFSTLELSGGQRKRLAMVVSLLEQRLILLLDEWTAEQDPEFRRKFYDDVLPSLQRAGTTVVMITHDSSYLDGLTLPARRLHMEEGRFIELKSGESR
jgi:putative pyoverdin transport system ATP-binding/permease protein